MLSRKSNLAPSLAQPKEGRRQGEETQREEPWTDHNILHKVHSTNFTLLLNQATKRASSSLLLLSLKAAISSLIRHIWFQNNC